MYGDTTSVSSNQVELNQFSTNPGSMFRSRRVQWLFAVTTFLSAFLLFQVQLIVSKYILPWFGGSSAVWSTSMLVFQVLLLAGYIYSHLLSQCLPGIAQRRVHLSLLVVVSLFVLALQIHWPSAITPSAAWKPEFSVDPVLRVVLILVASCGLPFFALATTGPLLQHWYAHLGSGERTYKLYSISNLGSLLGLLTFPVLFEPLLPIKVQGLLWSLLFLVFAAGCAACLLEARLHASDECKEESSGGAPEPLVRRPGAYSMWFLLPACASALLLATTNLLCQDVTSVPLLWVLPLSLYLLSFILCFDHPRWYRPSLFHPVFVAGVFLICGALVYETGLLQLLTLPVLLFLACMICHGELVRLKPKVQQLTAFYLTVSAGGVAGGIFVALIAPHIFTFFTEFQIAVGATIVLALACLFQDPESWLFTRNAWLSLAIGIGLILAAFGAGQIWPEVQKLLWSTNFYPLAGVIVLLVAIGAYTFRNASDGVLHRFRFVQVLVFAIAALAIAVLVRSTRPLPGLFFSARNFYGAIRVFNVPRGRMLMHGHTIHGGQFDAPFDREPATYYGRESGIGAVMTNHPHRSAGSGNLRVEIVGLGSGTLAAYGKPGDYFRYYEINPKVLELSTRPQPVFTYLRDSPARVDVALGDARLLMERESFAGEDQKYDVVVVDAFSGDAIPVHLLTREAFETYWQHLNGRNGVIAIHISSRHVNLLPVIQGAADYFGADSLIYYEEGRGPFLSNCWFLLARSPGVLESLGLQAQLPPGIKATPTHLWTDDFSDIITLMKK